MPTPVVFVLHNHQPVGNFPEVFEACFATAYAPFLAVLERHPRARVGLHITGPLLEWLHQYQPAYLARVRALVARGQVEVLGGGMYEPILSVIPEADRDGQLARLRESVTETFGVEPTGVWLAERIWEPTLPVALARAGAHYALVDDEAWLRLGYSETATQAVYVTEDQGAMVRLLPISRRLRYTIPTVPVEEIVASMRAMAADGARVLVYAEDGERYGNWPGTFDYLYGDEAYLDRLLTALTTADDLEMVLPGDYVRTAEPAGRVYLPPASYAEMLHWSGGFWRHFLTRYAESNLMHKKMLQVSRWLATAKAAGAYVGDAERDLYAAQCNCPYWHGTFGGLYLPHLRRATYAHLLCAERALAPLLPPAARPACEVADLDCDGRDEVVLRDGDVSLGIAPAQGGGVFALEHLGVAHNFLATLGRHALRADEGEVADGLPVDWYPRLGFLDHLLGPEVSVEEFRDACYDERGDFVTGAYQIASVDAHAVTLRRDGSWRDGETVRPLRIDKTFSLVGEQLTVAYQVTNLAAEACTLRLAIEVDAALSAGDAPGRMLTFRDGDTALTASPGQTATLDAPVSSVCYGDDWLGVTLEIAWDRPAPCLVAPLYCPTGSLDGLEWVYQSTVILPTWEVTLLPGSDWYVTFSIRIMADRATCAGVGQTIVGNCNRGSALAT